MPYARPSLTDLIAQATQDITAAQITDPTTEAILEGLLAQAVLFDVVNAEAALTYLLYAYLDWIALQAVPWTATDEFMYAWGALKGVFPKDATAAAGSFTITGAANGVLLPAGTKVTRQDTTPYITTADGTTSGGAVTVPITCSLTGAIGNCASGTPLTLSASIAGIPTLGAASTIITGGSDQETSDDFRTRMLQVYAAPPQGGDRADYVEWAEAVPGVTRAWVAPNANGAGTVAVYTMFDEAEAAFNGFPQGANGVSQFDQGPNGQPRATVATGDQLAVADSICLKQPVTALVSSYAPIAQSINFSIGNLGAGNTAANQAAIQAALTDMFLRLGYVGGTLDPSTGEAWTQIDPSDWYAAIGAAPGVTRFSVTAPTAPLTITAGSLPVLGTCAFSA